MPCREPECRNLTWSLHASPLQAAALTESLQEKHAENTCLQVGLPALARLHMQSPCTPTVQASTQSSAPACGMQVQLDQATQDLRLWLSSSGAEGQQQHVAQVGRNVLAARHTLRPFMLLKLFKCSQMHVSLCHYTI